MATDPLPAAAHRKPSVDWSRILFWSAIPGTVVLIVALVLAGIFWMPLVPKDLGRTVTEGFLRTFLVGYAVSLVLSATTFATLAWAVFTNRRAFFRRTYVPRILLSGSTLLICLVLAELMAWAWLGWVHRFPGLPTRFSVNPASGMGASRGGELSLVVIGGSSALGYPYNPHLSIGQIVGRRIERAIPGKAVRVDILAKMGANLERMHQELAGLKRRPDAVIINCGNNEFLARFEPQRNAGLSEAPLNPILGPLYALSLRSPLCRLVYETISKNRLGGRPVPVNHPDLIDPPVYTPSEFATVLAEFRRRLEAIVSWCEHIDALPILVIPPGNLSGYEPNRNVLPDRVTSAEREELSARFKEARGLERADPSRAIALYRGIVEKWPEFAEGHFRLGRLLEAAGRWDEAKLHYEQAREHDGFPMRVLDVFQDAYRDAAGRHGCILVDGPRLFESVAPHGIVGDDFFHDAHHPTLRGHATLAEAVASELQERHAFGWPADSNRPDPAAPDLVGCLKDFPMDARAWDGVCACTFTFYRDLSNLRFDPSERKAKQRAYEDARPKLEAGVPPERLGIPGMGLVPPGSLPPKWWEK